MCSMAVLVLACVILVFLPPCFSNSCRTTLPCSPSIQIKPPFYFQSDNELEEVPNCGGNLRIGCNNYGKAFLQLWYYNKRFLLENISYDPNVITVQAPDLSSSLNESDCGNLYFNFSTPVYDFDDEMYDLLNTCLSPVICHPLSQMQSPPEAKIFRKGYNISYSSCPDEYDKPLPNCSRPEEDSDRTFELNLLFRKDSSVLSLQSASYSNGLFARPSCFAKTTEIDCEVCPDFGTNYSPPTEKKSRATTKKSLIGAAVGSLTFIVGLILFIKLQCCKCCAECILSSKYRTQENIEMLLEKYGSFAPKRYKYGEVKKITHSFQESLGKGGFGTVYKGKLPDGRLVAVKILHNSSSHGEEILNEVLSIGRTSHVNVVSLLGFCIEGSKHALIYEYMPNGSLDNYIYCENPKAVLGWEKLYEIVVGIARGLEYLHRGCNARIVHFDIKPQNVLLDEDFNPKIADFGLAKLCPPKESILSMAEMRGTIGYIAPEVFSRSFGVVSTKSDVYSYGMMVLEMVGGRRNAKPSTENPSRVYFPHWLYDCLAEGCQIQFCDGSIGNDEIAKKMGMVGLWCTQTMPANRPSISRVVEMLEKGLDELEMPPKPFSSSPPNFTILSADIYST